LSAPANDLLVRASDYGHTEKQICIKFSRAQCQFIRGHHAGVMRFTAPLALRDFAQWFVVEGRRCNP
jgi:hypothetical protein